MDLRWLLLLFAINLIYIIIGGICFSYLEYDNDQKPSPNTDIVERIMQQLPVGNGTGFTYTQVHTAISSVVASSNTTQVMNSNNSTLSCRWSILNAAFFATTVITTIGYGHLSPATEGGQLFLIFYAFLGIPLSLVFLAYVGVRICNLHQKLLKCIKCFKNPRLNNLLDTTVMVVLGITLFILVPAGIFHHMEGWSFITSCYFCVVTLSTIGFGDYVTGAQDIPWYRVVVCCWTVAGLAWFAAIINNVQTILQKELDSCKGAMPCNSRKKAQMEWTTIYPDESELHISQVIPLS